MRAIFTKLSCCICLAVLTGWAIRLPEAHAAISVTAVKLSPTGPQFIGPGQPTLTFTATVSGTGAGNLPSSINFRACDDDLGTSNDTLVDSTLPVSSTASGGSFSIPKSFSLSCLDIGGNEHVVVGDSSSHTSHSNGAQVFARSPDACSTPSGGGIDSSPDVQVTCDFVAPTCTATVTPTHELHVTVQDSASGLRSFQIIPEGATGGNLLGCSSTSLNLSGSAPSITPGTPSVNAVFTRADSTKGARLIAKVTDVAGNFACCDPELLDVQAKTGFPRIQTLDDIPRSESRVDIINGSPGLQILGVVVNRALFQVVLLKDNEEKSLDLSRVMKESNTIVFIAGGKSGGSATILIAEPTSG